MTIEKVKEVLPNCNCKVEILRQLNIVSNGRNNKQLSELIISNDLDDSHFDLKLKRRKYEVIEKTCPVCGDKFKTKKGHKSEKETCSYSCANTYFRSGEDHRNYKDFSEYTDKGDKHLSKKYRKRCFEHHEHKCVVCGEEKILDVHHYDENKLNNEPENLIPICPTHHNYYHSKYRDEVKDKIDEYYNWFKNNGDEV